MRDSKVVHPPRKAPKTEKTSQNPNFDVKRLHPPENEKNHVVMFCPLPLATVGSVRSQLGESFELSRDDSSQSNKRNSLRTSDNIKPINETNSVSFVNFTQVDNRSLAVDSVRSKTQENSIKKTQRSLSKSANGKPSTDKLAGSRSVSSTAFGGGGLRSSKSEEKPYGHLQGKPSDTTGRFLPSGQKKSASFPLRSSEEINLTSLNEKSEALIVDPTNILSTHESVLKILEKRHKDALLYKTKLERLKWIETNSDDKLERIRAKKNAFDIERIIRTSEGRREIFAYEKDVKDLLSRYVELETAERSFVVLENSASIAAEAERFLIVRTYVTITKKYIDIAMPTDRRLLLCENCGNRDFDVMDESLYACQSCGTCTRFLEETHSFKDVDRINLSSRYKYTRKTHFKEAYYNRMGQNVIVDEEVYAMLRELCRRYNIPLEKVTKDTVEMMLIENGYEKLREYALIIHRKLIGQAPPDISHLENELLDRFDLLEDVLPKILEEYGKTNSINVDYKVLKLLELLGVPCTRKDFDIHKDKLIEYDEIWERACLILGWQPKPTV